MKNSLKFKSNSKNLFTINEEPFNNFRKPSIPPSSVKINEEPFNGFHKPSIPPSLPTSKLHRTSNEYNKNPHHSLNQTKLNRGIPNEYDSTWHHEHQQVPFYFHIDTDTPVLSSLPDIPPLSTKTSFRKPFIPSLSINKLACTSKDITNPHYSLNQSKQNPETQNEKIDSTWHHEHQQKPYWFHTNTDTPALSNLSDIPPLSTKTNEEPIGNFQKPSNPSLTINKLSHTSNGHFKNTRNSLNQPKQNIETQNENNYSVWHHENQQMSYWLQTDSDAPVLPKQPNIPTLSTKTNKEPLNNFQKQSNLPLSTNKLSHTAHDHFKNSHNSLNEPKQNREIQIENNDSAWLYENQQLSYWLQTDNCAPVLPNQPDIAPLTTKTNEEPFNNFRKPSIPPLSTNKLSHTSNAHTKNPYHSLSQSKQNRETPNDHNDSTWHRDHQQVPYWSQTDTDAPVLPNQPDIYCKTDVPMHPSETDPYYKSTETNIEVIKHKVLFIITITNYFIIIQIHF